MQNILSSRSGDLWNLATNTLLALILVIGFLSIIRKKITPRGYRKIIVFCFFVIFISFFSWQIYAFVQYRESPIGKNLLPPHSTFFLQQVGAYMSNVVSGIIASAVVLMFGLWLVHKQRATQFGVDDWLLLSIGTLVVGWPAVLPFLALVIFMSMIGLIIQILLRKKSLTDRLIITPYIMPAAIVTLAAKAQILVLTHLDKIRF